MRSLTATCTKPTTALEATLFSHSQRLEHIEQQNPMYEPLSRTYGSRHTLEQVRIAIRSML